MKVLTKITIEKLSDILPSGQKAQSGIESQLNVLDVKAQLPDTGCATLSVRDAEIYRVTHETNVQDGNVVRFQFPNCGNMVTVSVSFREQPTADEQSAATLVSNFLADAFPNQSGLIEKF